MFIDILECFCFEENADYMSYEDMTTQKQTERKNLQVIITLIF